MATVYELGVQIGDRVRFPLWNPGDPGYPYQKGRHTATIVGPASFPKSAEVYLAPPETRGANIYFYNPKTDQLRSTMEITGRNKYGDAIMGPSSLHEGEILIRSIHTEYTLFTKAQ